LRVERHPGLDPGSSFTPKAWIPAFAGMTERKSPGSSFQQSLAVAHRSPPDRAHAPRHGIAPSFGARLFEPNRHPFDLYVKLYRHGFCWVYGSFFYVSAPP
jgi:hypothetical protein